MYCDICVVFDCMFFEVVFVFEFISWFSPVSSVFISMSQWFWCWVKHLSMTNVMINDTTFYHSMMFLFSFSTLWFQLFFHEVLIVLLLWKNFVMIIFTFSRFLWFLSRIVIKTMWKYVNIKKNTKSLKNSCQKNCSQKPNYTTYKYLSTRRLWYLWTSHCSSSKQKQV